MAATEAPISHRSGVTVFYRKVGHFTLEALCLHVPNVVSFQMATGHQRCHVVGCYITTDDESTIEDAVAAISRQHQGSDILVAGNYNADLEVSEGTT